MSRSRDALKVGAVVGACAVCCPALVLIPLGLLGGLGASATATTAVLGAPAWLVASLLLLTATLAAAGVRRRRGQRRAIVPMTAQGRLTLPPTEATGSLPGQTTPSHAADSVRP